jgi:hypothetical protein
MNEDNKKLNRWEETLCPEVSNCASAKDRDRFYRICVKYHMQEDCSRYRAKFEFDVERRCE